MKKEVSVRSGRIKRDYPNTESKKNELLYTIEFSPKSIDIGDLRFSSFRL